jgi:predicted MFS family arabinose efflux permease
VAATAGPRASTLDTGGLLGGYFADRSDNLRTFVFVPLIVVSPLLIAIPVVQDQALGCAGLSRTQEKLSLNPRLNGLDRKVYIPPLSPP